MLVPQFVDLSFSRIRCSQLNYIVLNISYNVTEICARKKCGE